MLDDLKHIHRRDTQDALGAIGRQWMQYKQALSVDWKPERSIHNVIVMGMGSSSLAAQLFRTWPGVDVPFEVVQGYRLPEYAQANTLLIIASYSGDSEEAVYCFRQALEVDMTLKQRPMIVAISAGGAIEELAKSNGIAHITLPNITGSRLGFGHQFRALLELFERTPLLGTAAVRNAEQAAEWLRQEGADWSPEIPTKDNLAKQIARELVGKSVAIYSGPQLAGVAQLWKLSINTSAKQLAWCDTLPEAAHGELMGWSKQPVQKPYAIIELQSRLEPVRIQKQFIVMERLLSGLRPSPIPIGAMGDDMLHQLLYLTTLGEYVSVYLALINNIDPAPLELIEKFRHAMEA